MSDDSVLWSSEHHGVLETLDELRSQGFKCLVDTPRIIVCGDQSCGKSSLIRGITGLDLPGSTRFATELVFQRGQDVGVTTTILPASDRSEPQQRTLSAFYRYQNYLDIRRPLEDATQILSTVTAETTFCPDVLRIEVTGPTQPHLTLVDLPGLLPAGNQDHSEQYIKGVRDLMLDYMSQKQNVILAVISAENSFALQQITRYARHFDPRGTRTLGIITKPDALDVGSESEHFYAELTQNTADFPLGWHVICNQDYADGKESATKRDQAEENFFAEGVWRNCSHCGVPALRVRLSRVLYYQTVSKLPGIIEEVRETIKDTEKQLLRLGPSRDTINEQKRHAFRVGGKFSSLMKAAIDGLYTGPFFMNSEPDAYSRRLRTVVHDALSDFAVKMREQGQAKLIQDDMASQTAGLPGISQTYNMEEVQALLRQSHVHTLPGTYNPVVVSELFRKQCKPWPGLVQGFGNTIMRCVESTVNATLHYVADDDTAARMCRVIISPWLQKLGEDLRIKLDELLEPHLLGHLAMHNRPLSEKVYKTQTARKRGNLERQLISFYGNVYDGSGCKESSFPIEPLVNWLMGETERSLSLYTCFLALDTTEAYYEVSDIFSCQLRKC